MRKTITAAAIATLATLAAGGANAYTTYFGEDLNGTASPLTVLTNSAGAETSFKGSLVGVGTEDFETRSGVAPLAITFPGASASLTATLQGGGGIVAVTPGTAPAGRYSIPSGTSSKYWEVTAGGGGQFSVDFSTKIAAFGFYGIDIGDYGGSLSIDLMDGNTVVQTVNVGNTVGSNGNTNGSVLYFGVIAGGTTELFNRVRFNSTAGQGDVFAFDNFTIGELEQVVPEPASLALVGAALLGLSLTRRRRG